jgi:hypothetical protein
VTGPVCVGAVWVSAVWVSRGPQRRHRAAAMPQLPPIEPATICAAFP